MEQSLCDFEVKEPAAEVPEWFPVTESVGVVSVVPGKAHQSYDCLNNLISIISCDLLQK